MKVFAVSFTPAAVQDLEALYDYIAESTGYVSKALAMIERLEEDCRSIGKFPLCGRSRDDVMKGLRIIPIGKKGIAAYLVNEGKKQVLILNVFYGGRDYETLMRNEQD